MKASDLQNYISDSCLSCVSVVNSDQLVKIYPERIQGTEKVSLGPMGPMVIIKTISRAPVSRVPFYS